jgi:HAE1 family hydrophobic/amphiphilic exporter-1
MICSVAITALVGRTLGTELLPEVHQGEFTVEINLPVGTPLEETQRILGKVEKEILANRDGIKALLVTYGYDVTNMKRSDEGEHSARIKVLVESGRSVAALEEIVLARIRGYLKDIPDITERVVRPVLFSSNKPIVVEIQGENLTTLRRMAHEAEVLLQDHPELADVETTLKRGAPEIQISYDRQSLSRFGLNLAQVAEQVKNLVKGFEATRYNLKDRRIPIIVQLQEEDRQLIHHIENLTVNPASEQPIPLRAIANLEIGEGPSEIRRIDSKRVALIQSNLGQASLGKAVDSIRATLLTKLEWPAEMSFAFSGQNEEWERSQSSLLLALGLSIFLVYVIMASQFESLVQPLIIMGTVPLAFLGSVIGLKLLGISLSIVVFLGLIMLIGIVVNNAIVLVDYTNVLRNRGLSAEEAVCTAGSVRLRPILMTTATTVLGLFPMALGLGDGAEIRTPMAIAVIFGLISSTALTLLVIPTLYLLVDKALATFIKPSQLNASAESSPLS